MLIMETVKVYRKGLIVLPSSVRRRLGISEGDTLVLRVEGDAIVLVPKRSAKALFGSFKAEDLVEEMRRERRREVEEVHA